MDKYQLSNLIKVEATKAGFADCGIAKAEFLVEEAARLEQWLKENRHGQMEYMANHFDKRLDPTKLVPGARSVISLIYNYYPHNDTLSKDEPKIARYAYGKDYHKVIRKKLKHLVATLKEKIGDFEGRVFVDSAPVLEKTWANKAGLGWIGKNANLISKKKGSYFFLAEIICDLTLAYDSTATDHCGECSLCIDACPTEAIIKPYVVDGSKCISYFTIELKESIPQPQSEQLNGWVFGCDICQEVCPWNRHSSPHNEPAFMPNKQLLNFTKRDWLEMTEEVFDKVFEGSALKRAKYTKIKKQLALINT